MYATAQEAEEAFYEAFNQRNIKNMMGIWEQDDQVVCIHPMIDRVTGYDNVMEIWQDIFSAAPDYTMEVRDSQRTLTRDLAIHVVHEHIVMRDKDKVYPPMVATNIYRLTEDGWRMVLHHASPTPEISVEEKEKKTDSPIFH